MQIWLETWHLCLCGAHHIAGAGTVRSFYAFDCTQWTRGARPKALGYPDVSVCRHIEQIVCLLLKIGSSPFSVREMMEYKVLFWIRYSLYNWSLLYCPWPELSLVQPFNNSFSQTQPPFHLGVPVSHNTRAVDVTLLNGVRPGPALLCQRLPHHCFKRGGDVAYPNHQSSLLDDSVMFWSLGATTASGTCSWLRAAWGVAYVRGRN